MFHVRAPSERQQIISGTAFELEGSSSPAALVAEARDSHFPTHIQPQEHFYGAIALPTRCQAGGRTRWASRSLDQIGSPITVKKHGKYPEKVSRFVISEADEVERGCGHEGRSPRVAEIHSHLRDALKPCVGMRSGQTGRRARQSKVIPARQASVDPIAMELIGNRPQTAMRKQGMFKQCHESSMGQGHARRR
jgi:hypothetical protein